MYCIKIFVMIFLWDLKLKKKTISPILVFDKIFVHKKLMKIQWRKEKYTPIRSWYADTNLKNFMKFDGKRLISRLQLVCCKYWLHCRQRKGKYTPVRSWYPDPNFKKFDVWRLISGSSNWFAVILALSPGKERKVHIVWSGRAVVSGGVYGPSSLLSPIDSSICRIKLDLALKYLLVYCSNIFRIFIRLSINRNSHCGFCNKI